MAEKPLSVAWISYFPVEWLPDPPPEARLPRRHPAPWQRTLLAELAQRADLRLHVIVTRKQFPRDVTFERDGVTFHCLKVQGGLRAPSLFWTDTRRIRSVVAAVQPDLIHAWGTESGAALVAARLGRPYLVTIQGLLGWLGTQVPLNRYQRVMSWLEKFSLRRARSATAESAFAAAQTRREWPQLTVRRIEVVPGWEFHRVVRRPPADRIRVVLVGGLNFAKGGDLLLRAFGALRQRRPLELIVVGRHEPDWPAALQKQIPAGTLAAVQFRPDLTSAQVADELAAATLAVCPTRADTGPMSAKEAVVAGVPLVGSRVGGIPEYVVAGRNGLLFEPGDAAGLTAALEAACEHPEFRRGEVDLEIRDRLRRELSPALCAQNFLECYRETLATTKQREGSGGAPFASSSR